MAPPMVELSTSGAAAAPEQAVVHIGVLSMQACSVPGPADDATSCQSDGRFAGWSYCILSCFMQTRSTQE